MNDQDKQKIEDTRAKVQALGAKQQELYRELVEDLGIKDDLCSEPKDYLWDYIFNCDKNTPKQYLAQVQKNIYKLNKQN